MRRQFITHPGFQFKFTLSFIFGVIFIFSVLGGSTILALVLLARDPLVSESQRLVLLANAKEFSSYLGYLTVLSILALGWIGFYLSYKFVGPLHRLESWVGERIDNRNTDPIQLRPSDELEPIALVLNRIVLRKFGVKGER